jgi:hypothetical protein
MAGDGCKARLGRRHAGPGPCRSGVARTASRCSQLSCCGWRGPQRPRTSADQRAQWSAGAVWSGCRSVGEIAARGRSGHSRCRERVAGGRGPGPLSRRLRERAGSAAFHGRTPHACLRGSVRSCGGLPGVAEVLRFSGSVWWTVSLGAAALAPAVVALGLHRMRVGAWAWIAGVSLPTAEVVISEVLSMLF